MARRGDERFQFALSIPHVARYDPLRDDAGAAPPVETRRVAVLEISRPELAQAA